MNSRDMQRMVWKSLGPRKWLVGRQGVDLLTKLTIDAWPTEYYRAAASDEARQQVSGETLNAVKRVHQVVGGYSDREYGMIWALLLSAVASAIIQVVLKWWLERRSHQVMLMVWQQEALQ